MKESIGKILNLIAIKENIEILFAAESGSRAWGFDSKDSDYDIRFIYRRSPSYYLSIFPDDKATLDSNNTDIFKSMMEHHNLDFVGHDVKKTLKFLFEGNPNIASWFRSPHVYNNSRAGSLLSDVSLKYFKGKKAAYAYSSIANSNFKNYILHKNKVVLKKYLYVARGLACAIWVDIFNSPPPMILEEALYNKYVRVRMGDSIEYIAGLLNSKKEGIELSEGDPIPELNTFYAAELENLKVRIGKKQDDENLEKEEFNEIFRQSINF